MKYLHRLFSYYSKKYDKIIVYSNKYTDYVSLFPKVRFTKDISIYKLSKYINTIVLFSKEFYNIKFNIMNMCD